MGGVHGFDSRIKGLFSHHIIMQQPIHHEYVQTFNDDLYQAIGSITNR